MNVLTSYFGFCIFSFRRVYRFFFQPSALNEQWSQAFQQRRIFAGDAAVAVDAQFADAECVGRRAQVDRGRLQAWTYVNTLDKKS